MHIISVKELRTKFPFVRSELKKGTTFLIIHKSKPIAELKPVNGKNGNGALIASEAEDEDFKMWEEAAIEDMNKYLPPLTKEEHDYYMSLAPLKDKNP